MAPFKRDRAGFAKKFDGPKPAPKPTTRNAYTPMFEAFRDELDAHHDRRDRLGKASRDVTALSKKMIFALQRVRQIHPDLPPDIQTQLDQRLTEIAGHLATIAPEVQGINRYRYSRSMSCLEELVEALSFAHYLRTQRLITLDELNPIIKDLTIQGFAATKAKADAEDKAAAKTVTKDGDDAVMNDVVDAPADVQVDAPAKQDIPDETAAAETEAVPITELSDEDYLFGIFDLTGEMMRFATTAPASILTGTGESGNQRTIVQDMQNLGSFFETLPLRRDKQWVKKVEVMEQSIRKVERLGYDRVVRGSERPEGWVPDLDQDEGGGGFDEE